MAAPPVLPPTGTLPTEAYVIARLQATDPLLVPSMGQAYANIVPLALKIIAEATDLQFPNAAITSERMVYDGKADFLLPARYPVTKITKALFQGSQTLRIATNNGLNEIDLSKNLADVAIGQGGEVVSLANWLTNGFAFQQASIYVDYEAGYSELPLDLLEVFFQLITLMAVEYMRRGKVKEKVGEAQTDFTRDLPLWAKRTLLSYQRVNVYV